MARESTQGEKNLGHLLLKNGKRQGNQVLPGNHDDIDRWPYRAFQRPENFPYFSFGPVPGYRVAYFLRRDDTEPFPSQLVGQKKHRANPVDPSFLPPVHHLLELRALGQPFTLAESEFTHASNGQPFASFASSVSQYLAAADGGVSFAKTVRPFPANILGLVRSFHEFFSPGRL